MVKKKVEMEIEYPECTSCHNGIFDGEKYFEIGVSLSKMTCHRGDGYSTTGISTRNTQNPIIVCENCFLNDEAKKKIMLELERQKQELEKR